MRFLLAILATVEAAEPGASKEECSNDKVVKAVKGIKEEMDVDAVKIKPDGGNFTFVFPGDEPGETDKLKALANGETPQKEDGEGEKGEEGEGGNEEEEEEEEEEEKRLLQGTVEGTLKEDGSWEGKCPAWWVKLIGGKKPEKKETPKKPDAGPKDAGPKAPPSGDKGEQPKPKEKDPKKDKEDKDKKKKKKKSGASTLPTLLALMTL